MKKIAKNRYIGPDCTIITIQLTVLNPTSPNPPDTPYDPGTQTEDAFSRAFDAWELNQEDESVPHDDWDEETSEEL